MVLEALVSNMQTSIASRNGLARVRPGMDSSKLNHRTSHTWIQYESQIIFHRSKITPPRKQPLYNTYIAVVYLVYSWCQTWFKYYKSMWSSHSPGMSATLQPILLTRLYPLWSIKEGILIFFIGYDLNFWQVSLRKNMVWTLTLRRLSLITKHFSNVFVTLFFWYVEVN